MLLDNKKIIILINVIAVIAIVIILSTTFLKGNSLDLNYDSFTNDKVKLNGVTFNVPDHVYTVMSEVLVEDIYIGIDTSKDSNANDRVSCHVRNSSINEERNKIESENGTLVGKINIKGKDGYFYHSNAYDIYSIVFIYEDNGKTVLLDYYGTSDDDAKNTFAEVII